MPFIRPENDFIKFLLIVLLAFTTVFFAHPNFLYEIILPALLPSLFPHHDGVFLAYALFFMGSQYAAFAVVVLIHGSTLLCSTFISARIPETRIAWAIRGARLFAIALPAIGTLIFSGTISAEGVYYVIFFDGIIGILPGALYGLGLRRILIGRWGA